MLPKQNIAVYNKINMLDKKIRVAVVDDEPNCRNELIYVLNEFFNDRIETFECSEYSSGEEFLKEYKDSFDVIFLDIEMNEINGMDVAREIRKNNEVAVIIFVTRLLSYAIEGYSVSAFDYVLKPFDKNEFNTKMNRVLKKVEESKLEKSILVKTNYKDRVIKIKDIKFVEVMGHNILFHTKDETISSWGTLNDVIAQINSESFGSCNRCYYVNFNYVTGMEGSNLYLGNDVIQISRYKKAEFLNELAKYLGKKE